jgi:SAM-dependent methyltransferase
MVWIRRRRRENDADRASGEAAVTDFDEFAEDYDALLEEGLAPSGESKEYFARGRVSWLKRRLQELRFTPRAILDFGCGTGSAIPHLLALPGVDRAVGADVSRKSLEVARRDHGSQRADWIVLGIDPDPTGLDLAFCNGVFHHIEPDKRGAMVRWLFRSLRPGGLFALWENNPWNPGTRYIMKRSPLDAHALPLSPPQARRLLASGGFEIVGTDFLFIFPRALGSLRWLEPPLARLPLGGQYQVLARKP